MKTYNSIALGICINNNDPEKRGRVQIFIPHIMPSLYEGWNKEGLDINIDCVGDNMINGLTSDKLELLKKILPWAEAASPICATSAPGTLIQAAGNAVAGAAKGFLTGGLGGAVAGGIKGFYDQSPYSQTNNTPSNNGIANSTGTAAAADVAASYVNNSNPFGDSSHGGDPTLNSQAGGDPSNGTSMSCGRFVSLSLQQAGVPGPWQSGVGGYVLPANGFKGMGQVITDPSQIQKGDVVVVASKFSNSGSHVGIAGTNPATGNLSFISNPGTSSTITAHDMSSNYVSSNFQYAVRLSQPTNSDPSQAPTPSAAPTSSSPSAAPAAVANIHSTSEGGIHTSDSTAANYASPDPTASNTTPAGAGNLSASATSALTQAQGSGTLTQIQNGSNASEISDDSNGNPYSLALEGGGGAGNTNTSLTDSNGKSIDAMNIPYIAVANKADIGKPFAVQINNNPPIVCIGADSSTSSGNGAVLGTNNAAGVNNYHGEISTAAMIAAGGGVVQGSSGLLKGTTLAPGATMSVAPITDGSIPSFSVNNPPTPEQLQQYYGSQLTADQKAQLQKLTDNAANHTGVAGTAGNQVGASSTALVNNTSPHGAPAIQNLNNTAKGLFTYPNAGAMLWVFFREGNPLYPVYFAASYSNSEWKSAYGYGSDGPGYTPVAGESGVTSTGTVLNWGSGGIRTQDDIHPTDITKNKKYISFHGYDGSNMFIGDGYHQLYSKFDRRDQVEGDRWNTTLGHEEHWTQGDYNHVTMGNMYIKVGNVSKPAVDAVNKHLQILKDSMKPLTELNN